MQAPNQHLEETSERGLLNIPKKSPRDGDGSPYLRGPKDSPSVTKKGGSEKSCGERLNPLAHSGERGPHKPPNEGISGHHPFGPVT